MPERYNKPALTIEQQLALLTSRGMTIDDLDCARTVLAHISYYRLSAYWYPFRQTDAAGQKLDAFRLGTTFDRVVELYEFDRQLRLELLDAVERVEVALRTSITYRFSLAAGAFGHTDRAQFRAGFDHADWLRRVEEEIGRSHEAFVDHFRERYDGFPRLPLWMATEVMSFGSLSKLFSNVAAAIQTEVARPIGVNRVVLVSWMHVLSVVRNLCAHHARMWNRELGVRPRLPERDRRWSVPATDRLFAVLLVLRHVLRVQGEGSSWASRIERLVEPIAERGSNARSMGLPARWTEHPIWRGA